VDFISDLIFGILKFILKLLISIVFFYLFFFTGEMILKLITLGKKKINWDCYAYESTIKWFILTDISSYIGAIFWGSILYLIMSFV
jgi:hypothetical protein